MTPNLCFFSQSPRGQKQGSSLSGDTYPVWAPLLAWGAASWWGSGGGGEGLVLSAFRSAPSSSWRKNWKRDPRRQRARLETPQRPSRSPAPTHLHGRGCGGRGRLGECPGPLGLTGLILIFLSLLNGRGLPGGGGSRSPSRLPSGALGRLAAAGVRRQVGGQWVMDVVGGLTVVCREKGTWLPGTASLPGHPAPSPGPSR